MMQTWFTSDTHFSHTNILTFEAEARPFATIEEMNETLIERWNSCVRPQDTIYHLGDFCFGGEQNIAIAARLNGHKRLVLGNHDRYPITEYAKYFEKIYGVKFWEGCILTHVPVHPGNMQGEKRRCVLNLHGHLHSKKMKEPEYFNCSVENHDLTPVHADVISGYMAALRFSQLLQGVGIPENTTAYFGTGT